MFQASETSAKQAATRKIQLACTGGYRLKGGLESRSLPWFSSRPAHSSAAAHVNLAHGQRYDTYISKTKQYCVDIMPCTKISVLVLALAKCQSLSFTSMDQKILASHVLLREL